MRSPIFKIFSKTTIRPIIRKREKHKQRKKLRLKGNDVGKEKMENLNEVLRLHKTQTIDSSNSWKLEPKDSCEVYKARIKRQSGGGRKKQPKKQGTENEQDMVDKTKRGNGVRRSRARKPARKRRRRPRSEDYLSDSDRCSHCCSCQSMSYSSASESNDY